LERATFNEVFPAHCVEISGAPASKTTGGYNLALKGGANDGGHEGS
jgi:hypothetical protein